jgi:hypothetical protein
VKRARKSIGGREVTVWQMRPIIPHNGRDYNFPLATGCRGSTYSKHPSTFPNDTLNLLLSQDKTEKFLNAQNRPSGLTHAPSPPTQSLPLNGPKNRNVVLSRKLVLPKPPGKILPIMRIVDRGPTKHTREIPSPTSLPMLPSPSSWHRSQHQSELTMSPAKKKLDLPD